MTLYNGYDGSGKNTGSEMRLARAPSDIELVLEASVGTLVTSAIGSDVDIMVHTCIVVQTCLYIH